MALWAQGVEKERNISCNEFNSTFTWKLKFYSAHHKVHGKQFNRH